MVQFSALRTTGAGFPRGAPPIANFTAPAASNASGRFFGSSGIKGAPRNWVTGDEGVVTGTITEPGLGFVNYGAESYLDTGIPETLAMSFIIAYRNPSTTVSTGVIGAFVSGPNLGVGLQALGNGDCRLFVGKVGEVQDIQTIDGVAGGWNLVSVSVPATGSATIKNHTTDVTSTSTNTTARLLVGSDNILIGGLINGTLRQPLDIGVSALFTDAKTPAFMDAQAAWAREHMAVYGITV